MPWPKAGHDMRLISVDPKIIVKVHSGVQNTGGCQQRRLSCKHEMGEIDRGKKTLWWEKEAAGDNLTNKTRTKHWTGEHNRTNRSNCGCTVLKQLAYYVTRPLDLHTHLRLRLCLGFGLETSSRSSENKTENFLEFHLKYNLLGKN